MEASTLTEHNIRMLREAATKTGDSALVGAVSLLRVGMSEKDFFNWLRDFGQVIWENRRGIWKWIKVIVDGWLEGESPSEKGNA